MAENQNSIPPGTDAPPCGSRDVASVEATAALTFKGSMAPWFYNDPKQFTQGHGQFSEVAVYATGNAFPWRMCEVQGPDQQTVVANARLIAAAPELLDAAIRAFIQEVGFTLAHKVQANGWKWPEDAPERVSITAEALRAAIAKALGGDQ